MKKRIALLLMLALAVTVWAAYAQSDANVFDQAASWLEGVAEWGTQAASDAAKWGTQAASDAAEWGAHAAADLTEWGTQAAADITEWGTQAAADIAEWGAQAADDLSGGAQAAREALLGYVDAAERWFNENYPNWNEQVQQAWSTLKEAAIDGSEEARAKAKEAYQTVRDWLEQNGDAMSDGTEALVDAMGEAAGVNEPESETTAQPAE